MYEPLVRACMRRPQFMNLKTAYSTYQRDLGLPCKRGVANQCAVRMSIALGRAGFGLESFRPSSRVHDGGKLCKTDGMPHVLGANELARWLKSSLGLPEMETQKKKGEGCAEAYDKFKGRTGILYFDNCFTRAGESVKVGDHIDLFDGARYYNQILHPSAGGNESSIGNLFAASGAVWFWPIT